MAELFDQTNVQNIILSETDLNILSKRVSLRFYTTPINLLFFHVFSSRYGRIVGRMISLFV